MTQAVTPTFHPKLTRGRVMAARLIAVAADALQIVVFPLFFEGVLSPINAVLDLIVAILMIWLCGWHIAFLPAFFAEQVPYLDLAPTWVIAVLIATRGQGKPTPQPLSSQAV